MAREPRNRGGTNICFDCKKACGGCSWSEWDAVNKKPRFEPVKGWKAIKVPYLGGAGRGAKIDSTYYITECPEFQPEDNYRGVSLVPSCCAVCGKEFTPGESKSRRYCYSCVPFGYARNPKNGYIYKHSWLRQKERSAKHKEECDD